MILVSTYGTVKQKAFFYAALAILSVPSVLYCIISKEYFDAVLLCLLMTTLLSSLYSMWKKKNEQTSSI
jgi:uncharacterized membrane protein YfcA